MLSVNNLRKSYNSLVAVDGVSFEVKKGETFGLLGPNGAGKSTTINMMVGLLKPDGGTVGINGDGDPLNSRVRLQIGNAPQTLSIYEDLTAEENLAFFGKLYGLSGKALNERIEWTLELSGLQDRKKDWVKTFSGGMKRRLNLVCA
ncbi:MAG: ATP-binding cassette domain-containing protein, partial [candidate division Zixibacteria bacterium]|nr:ATP-binding cassette domain-containing protein [candidate division Zixibacteria bacterium]